MQCRYPPNGGAGALAGAYLGATGGDALTKFSVIAYVSGHGLGSFISILACELFQQIFLQIAQYFHACLSLKPSTNLHVQTLMYFCFRCCLDGGCIVVARFEIL
jgi:hypothetical protein